MKPFISFIFINFQHLFNKQIGKLILCEKVPEKTNLEICFHTYSQTILHICFIGKNIY